MPNYRYRALNANGELVSGAIAAPKSGDVAQRIERLGLVLVDNVVPEEGGATRTAFSFLSKPRPEDVTIFTRDLALLLHAGARINDGLELLAADSDFGRLRPVVADIRSRIVSAKASPRLCRGTRACSRRCMWRWLGRRGIRFTGSGAGGAGR